MKNVSLGPLEQEVMACIWKRQHCTARDVWENLSKDREVAYNTIQTIMTRLVDKGLLKRKLEGKTHIYKPAAKQNNVLSSLLNQTMGNLTSQFGEEALIAFVDGLDDISAETRQKLIEKLLFPKEKGKSPPTSRVNLLAFGSRRQPSQKNEK